MNDLFRFYGTVIVYLGLGTIAFFAFNIFSIVLGFYNAISN